MTSDDLRTASTVSSTASTTGPANGPATGPASGAPAAVTAPRDSEQSQLDLGVISTGAADVDQAIGVLENISERPVDQHPEVYESVLSGLTAAMDDSGPSGS